MGISLPFHYTVAFFLEQPQALWSSLGWACICGSVSSLVWIINAHVHVCEAGDPVALIKSDQSDLVTLMTLMLAVISADFAASNTSLLTKEQYLYMTRPDVAELASTVAYWAAFGQKTAAGYIQLCSILNSSLLTLAVYDDYKFFPIFLLIGALGFRVKTAICEPALMLFHFCRLAGGESGA